MDGHYFFEKNPPWTALLGPGRLLYFDLLPCLKLTKIGLTGFLLHRAWYQ